MTKEIPLTLGLVALVDDEEYEYHSQFKWHAKKDGNLWYARRTSGVWPIQKKIYLHRVIMNPPPGTNVDHVNGDGLDCRRKNMRLATQSQNRFNSRTRSDNTSGFKGVQWRKDMNKWRAEIQVNGKRIHLGYHNSAIAAARAYDEAAKKHHGEFAKTNF